MTDIVSDPGTGSLNGASQAGKPRQVHLVCNAHLDPVWLWEWEEGAAETLSTFRTAADLCEAFDGFVFNHNEAVLYQWVELYEPATADVDTLLQHAAGSLAPYEVPVAVVFVETLPRTESGKPDLVAVRAVLEERVEEG